MKHKQTVLAFLFHVAFMFAGMVLFKALGGDMSWGRIIVVSLVVPAVISILRLIVDRSSKKPGT